MKISPANNIKWDINNHIYSTVNDIIVIRRIIFLFSVLSAATKKANNNINNDYGHGQRDITETHEYSSDVLHIPSRVSPWQIRHPGPVFKQC